MEELKKKEEEASAALNRASSPDYYDNRGVH
jgi:hypothetical protein